MAAKSSSRKNEESGSRGTGDPKAERGKATCELESSHADKRPWRRSSRGSANHRTPNSQLELRQTGAVRSPKARSQSRAG